MLKRTYRKGETTVSYVAVLLVCATLALSTTVLFVDSFQSLTPLISSVKNDVSPTKQLASRKLTEWAGDGESSFSFDMVHELCLIASTVSILVLTVLYVRQTLKKKKAEKNLEEHVDRLESSNAALKRVLEKQEKLDRFFRNDSLTAGTCTVADIMSTDIETICPTTPTSEVLNILNEKGYRRMIVVDRRGNLAGVVSKRDVQLREGETVEDIMTSDPTVTIPDMQIATALSAILKNRVTCLPVIKQEKFVGLLSTSDLMIYLQCLLHTGNTNQRTDELEQIFNKPKLHNDGDSLRATYQ